MLRWSGQGCKDKALLRMPLFARARRGGGGGGGGRLLPRQPRSLPPAAPAVAATLSFPALGGREERQTALLKSWTVPASRCCRVAAEQRPALSPPPLAARRRRRPASCREAHKGRSLRRPEKPGEAREFATSYCNFQASVGSEVRQLLPNLKGDLFASPSSASSFLSRSNTPTSLFFVFVFLCRASYGWSPLPHRLPGGWGWRGGDLGSESYPKSTSLAKRRGGGQAMPRLFSSSSGSSPACLGGGFLPLCRGWGWWWEGFPIQPGQASRFESFLQMEKCQERASARFFSPVPPPGSLSRESSLPMF